MAVAILAVAGAASAQDCVDYPMQLKDVAPFAGYGMARSPGHVYVAQGTRGLTVLQIAGGGLGVLDTPGNARDVAVQGTLAYVADTGGGLRIVDVSNPLAPAPVGALDTLTGARCVAVSDSLAFVGDTAVGIVVVNVSNPGAPTALGSVLAGGSPSGIAVSGSHLFVADESVGLVVIDVSVPATPAIVGVYVPAAPAHRVALSGIHAFLAADAAGLVVVNVADPTMPAYAAGVATPGSALDVSVDGGIAYVADQASGLAVVDVGVPGSPSLLFCVDTPSPAQGTVFADGLAYVAATDEIRSVDVFAPQPEPLGTVPTTGAVRDLEADGADCLVLDAAGLHYLRVVAGVPQMLGSLDVPGVENGVARYGSHAVVATPGALQVVDVSNPAAMTVIGSVTPPGTHSLWDVGVSGHHAFAADNRGLHDGGLVVFDLQVPTAPSYVTFVDLGRGVGGIEIQGDHLYCGVADGLSGATLRTFRIANPASPVQTNSLFFGYLQRFDVSNDRMAVPAVGAVRMYSLANPAIPAYQGSVALGALEVALLGNVVYASTEDTAFGLQVVDAANLAAPEITGALDTPGPTGRIDVSSQYVFLADGPSGVLVAPLQCDAASVSADVFPRPAGGPRLGPGTPNPFRGAVSFAADVPGDQPVRLDVYDVSGRHVRTLRRGPATAGRFTADWDGADDASRDVAPGVYFVRLSTPSGSAERRVTRLR